MGGRRDLQGRFQSAKSRISRSTEPSSGQDVGSTLVDPEMIGTAQMAHVTVCSHIPGSLILWNRARSDCRQIHDLTTMTAEDTFKSIVLTTIATTASLSNDAGVKTRRMKKGSLTPINNDQEITQQELATASNKKHNPSTPRSNATRKRALAQMNEDHEIAQLELATPSHKKQKTSPTDSSTSRDSMMSSIETPDTKISRDTTPSPAETPKANTSIRRKTKSSSKLTGRTKLKVRLNEATDRARRAETRAEKAEELLMLADNKNPERLRLDVLRYFKEELTRKSDQIEILSQQVEERELDIAQQKGRIRSHIDWEKTYKANLAEKREELKVESALVMDYLQLIVQKDGIIHEKDQTILKLEGELDGLRTTVTQKDEMIQKIDGDQKSVRGAIESIWDY